MTHEIYCFRSATSNVHIIKFLTLYVYITSKNGIIRTLFIYIYIYIYIYIQGIHKRIVRIQNLTRNLFLTSHGHNVHRHSGKCPSFSCATSSSLLMLTAGLRGQFPRWRRSRKRLSLCSVLRCPDL